MTPRPHTCVFPPQDGKTPPHLQPHAHTPLYRVRFALRERAKLLRQGRRWSLDSIRAQTSEGWRVPGAVVLWCARDTLPLTTQQVRQ